MNEPTGKWLIIAEKPSVAQDIARALGGFKRVDDYFESPNYLLSSAVGHLLELKAPEGSEPKRGKWSLAHLPVLPSHFDLSPIGKSEDRLKLLLRLAKRKEVVGLINACDAGREGELIFHYIITYGGIKKPVKRLWLQSMTPQAIRAAFAELRPAEALAGLRDAAVSRAESDWLIGINGTRALTAFNSQSGGFQLTPVGRVQTPTLAMVVDREREIRAFTPRPYWEVEADFAIAAGSYRGRWFREAFQKGEDPDATPFRLWSEEEAEAIIARCRGQQATVEESSKPAQQSAPPLFDLTSLQREANNRFGFSARQTLALAQALYERHKVLTYPRTDSRALPEDMIGTVPETLAHLPEPYQPFAQEILANGWVRPNKRIFDNSKVSDHFAIIPTGERPRQLNEAEARLFDLVVRRFLAIFYPPAEFRVTTRISRVGDDAFKSEGKVLVAPGWLTVYGRTLPVDDGQAEVLPPLTPGERAEVAEIAARALTTRPPARFTEATLLAAMEGAGKRVEDETLRAAMAERGLGTPATRAQIIEGLIDDHYLVREGRELIPTPKAFSLMTLLKGLGIELLRSPELTGEWEHRLALMEKGAYSRDQFMASIRQMAADIVERTKAHETDTVPGDFVTLSSPCPRCGGVVRENYKKFQCDACGWGFFKQIAGRELAVDEAETLIAKGRVGPLTGFRSKQGRPFVAELVLDESGEPKFAFDAPKEELSPQAAETAEVVGPCPKCGQEVVLLGNSYRCRATLIDPPQCDFRLGSTILKQPLTPEVVGELLTAKRTRLLEGFISARTRRPFKAHLTLEASGKVGFAFPENGTASNAPRRKGIKKQ
jgi:DNA topoisomerase-3